MSEGTWAATGGMDLDEGAPMRVVSGMGIAPARLSTRPSACSREAASVGRSEEQESHLACTPGQTDSGFALYAAMALDVNNDFRTRRVRPCRREGEKEVTSMAHVTVCERDFWVLGGEALQP